MAIDQRKTFEFPDDDVDPSEKEKPEWNLKIAEAIWGSNNRYGNTLFYNDRVRYRKIIQFMLGMNPEEDYFPFMGIKPDSNDKSWSKAINFRIKNYATKRVNIALTKILERFYEPQIDNIDPIAIDARDDMRARLQLFIDHRKWFDSVTKKTGINTAPNGLDPATLPISRDDIDLFMDLDYKTAEEIGMELGVKHHMERNHWESTRAEQAFFDFALGVSAVYCGLDENMIPLIESWHPGDIIVPFSNKPNFSELRYIAGIKRVTPAEFRKMATGFLSEEDIKDVLKNHVDKTGTDTYNYSSDIHRREDVGKITLMLYNYRSTDMIVAKRTEDQFGNKRIFRKSKDYYDEENGEDKFKEKFGESKKLYRKPYNTVYEGYYVVNTKYVFRQGRRAVSLRRRGNLSEDLMGFHVFAPNAWDGHIVSTGAQMIPMLEELQRYNLKVQQLVARAIPKGVGIDLYALRKATLKWDGKDLDDQAKIEMFIRSGIFVFDSKDRYAPGSNYKPFYEVNNGLTDDIQKYLSLMQQSLFELDEVIGFTRPAAATSLPADTGKGVTELQIAATDVAIGFLYSSDHRRMEAVVEKTAMLHVKSVKYGPTEYYNRIFGRLKTGVTYSEIPFDKFDYGFHARLQPTQQEWQEIYDSANKAYDKGEIRYADLVLLREVKSLKQARRYLSLLQNKYAQLRMNESMTLQQQNQQVQNDSIASKLAADKELEKFKHDLALELEESKRVTLELQMELQASQAMQEGLLKRQTQKEVVAVEGAQDRQTEQVRGIIQRQLAAIQARKPVKTKQ